jgi:glycogen(starch) synthase
MRVLFWSLTFWPNIGGLEVLTSKLLPSLRQRGYEFLVVAPKNYTDLPDSEEYEGIPIRRLAFQAPVRPGIDQVFALRQEVVALKRRFTPDLIHINGIGGPSDFFHLTTMQAHKAPVVVTLHNPWPLLADGIATETLLKADWVVGVSTSILERARRLASEINFHSSVIYNALPSPGLAPQPLPFFQPRLLCVGRLAYEKGVDIAIRAFRMILERFPRARLTIAGDGPLRSELVQQAASVGVDHAVDFIGWVVPDAVAALLNQHTLVLMPSREEPFGLVALQAALMSRPIVATRVGGLPEVVLHAKTGYLVDSEDAASMADAALLLLSRPELAKKLGRAARSRAQVVFGWEEQVDKYDTLYRKIAQQC